ncbi:MAG TPA: response regulator [Thermoanaerobaculia bacterium]|nr:response regulator [Thermoanaerobaculia bacterium]
MTSELADLVPLFVEEARERLEKLGGLLPRLEGEPQAAVEVRRELHTLKGAARMLRLGTFAELCHAAEEALQAPRAGAAGLLTRAADRLAGMVDAVARGEEPAADGELLAGLLEDRRENGRGAAAPVAGAHDRPRAVPAPPTAADLRLDPRLLDTLAEGAAQVRLMARGSQGAVERLDQLARLAEEGLHEPAPRQVLALLATMLRRTAVDLEGGQRRLAHAADAQLESLLGVQLQPLRGPLRSLARYARDLARSLGREVEVELEGEETRLDRRIARDLEEALLHLVRNAADHGIEPPAVREARGKPRAGKIRISARGERGRVRLAISDDGAGIDPARVVENGVRAGLVEEEAAAGLGREAVYRLLFTPGFSTRQEVSEISGRGVGLDVVATVVARLGGEVTLDSDLGGGTAVVLAVPVARRGEQVMMLRVGELRLALPSAAVGRAARVGQADLLERGGRCVARVGERLVPYAPLAALYGQPPAERPLLLEGAAAGAPLALLVDAVEGEQEVLVRPLTRTVTTDRLLEGVALLGSGEPVGVLSPQALARREASRAVAAGPPAPPARTRVLLVDDSPATREMERRLLEDAGFEVAAAADAEEALSRLEEGSFHCLVVDIEMPGMDGFELTERLRSRGRFAALPVVVVSTRDRPEDRLRGLRAGADAYLTKQTLDAGELVSLLRRLVGR